jgi:hypothetical protein
MDLIHICMLKQPRSTLKARIFVTAVSIGPLGLRTEKFLNFYFKHEMNDTGQVVTDLNSAYFER